MHSTRRRFLQTSTAALGAGALVPRPLLAAFDGTPEAVPPIQDARIKALVQRGLDAARAAGASYCDIRLSHIRRRNFMIGSLSNQEEELHAGVRALKDGQWGFAASPVWSPDELARLGREAVRQAAVNALGTKREVTLAPAPVIRDAHWETPVKIDPWTVSHLEIEDGVGALSASVHRMLRDQNLAQDVAGQELETFIIFHVTEQAFGSTEGSYCTQRLHWTEGYSRFNGHPLANDGQLLTPTAAGWEHVIAQPIAETIVRGVEEYREIAALPVKPLDVGLYDAVFDTAGVASLLSKTIGAATEVDRMLGYEANGGGTSYLQDPEETLDAFSFGAPAFTVTANRNDPGGVATVQWDAEGVTPEPFALVTKGVVTGVQTNRESAGWLRDAYTKRGRPIRSHGCAQAYTALDAPMIHTANLVMAPGTGASDVRELEAGLGKGISFLWFDPHVDFQCRSGLGMGMGLEIKNGKRVALVGGDAGVLFRTQELWKSILAVGGAASARRYGRGFFHTVNQLTKGQPKQFGCHSVTAVPMAVKEVTVIDPSRR